MADLADGDRTGPTTPRRVNVVPHTHWDREWYSPLQTFRLRLVDLVDELLDLMEGDASYAHFLLDGQMAMVDDYLEVRPENEERLRSLAAAGRLAFGPWYVLMDEFLVSGETILRNLELGLERAASFGGAMDVGYLPDMFGHIAQMPQVLKAAGFERAAVWRGVPAEVDKTGFVWEAPDGSAVCTEYLLGGYSVGASVADDAKAFVRRLEALESDRSGFLVPGAPMTFMNGSDHQRPQPWLGRVVAEANQLQDHFEIEITSLHDALARTPTEGVAHWRGELRSGARANVLMGVASNRVDVKQSAAAAQSSLEHLAEPLSALLLAPGEYPTSLLDLAWHELVVNSAHDSICACSHDEVVAAVLTRYAEASRIAEGLTDRALARLAPRLADAGHVMVNPTSRARAGVAELILGGEGPIEGAQILSERVGLAAELVLSTSEVRNILSQIDGRDQLGDGAYLTGVEVTEGEESIDVAVRLGPERREDLPVAEIKSDLIARMTLRPQAKVKVKLDQVSSRKVLVHVPDIPALGWRAFRPGPLADPVAARIRDEGTAVLEHSTTRVEISAADGTFSIDGVAGFDRLVDSGDHGDTYNYSPPEHDQVVDRPVSVTLQILESGPVRASALVRRTYHWPERVDDATRARVGEREVLVESRVELRAGDPLVRVSASFDNQCRDHRLRAIFPLAQPALESQAECAFGIVSRGLDAEGGPSERALPTFPSQRFVHAGGVTVCHDGLREYELVEIADGKAHAIALTLLRATGMLSRLTMTNRPLPAGPTDPLEGPQLRGSRVFRYAVCLGGDAAGGYELADRAFFELPVVASLGGGRLRVAGSLLSVHGAEVSAIRRVAGDVLEVRVFNPSANPSTVEIRSGSGVALRGDLVDLRGGFVGSFEGGFELAGCKLATLRLGRWCPLESATVREASPPASPAGDL